MTSPRWYWLIRDRRAFIAKLVETGDAEQAAHSIGRTLGDPNRLKLEHRNKSAT